MDSPRNRHVGPIAALISIAVVIGSAVSEAIAQPETAASWSTQGATGARHGWSVANAGDVNGDGYEDVIVGAPYVGQGVAGEVRYYAGSATGPTMAPWTQPLNWAGNVQSMQVAGVGDIDGDGYADFVAGAANTNGFGAFALYTGAPAGPVFEVIVLENAVAGGFGAAICGADVDGDGYDDVVVGEPLEMGSGIRRGRVRVYRGGPGGLSTIASWTLADNVGLDGFGTSVAKAGDVNADGFDDLLVGSTGILGFGRANLFLGGPSGPQPGGWSYQGEDEGPATGIGARGTIATAGDVNGDGRDDVLVGSPLAQNVRLFFATPTGLIVNPSTTLLAQGGDMGFGAAVAPAGDVNGDGYADVVVGAPLRSDGGRAAVHRGSPAGLATTALWDVHSPFATAHFGDALASLDGDGSGFPDMLVGAWSAVSNRGVAGLYKTYGGSRVAGLDVEVTLVDDPHGLLQGALGLGQPGSGFYSYDTRNGDTAPGTVLARYAFDQAPFLVDLRIGTLDLRADPLRPDVRLELENHAAGQGTDRFLVRSLANRTLPSGVHVDSIEVHLLDPSGTALASEHQIQRVQDLSSWPQEIVVVSGTSLFSPTQRFRIQFDVLEMIDVQPPSSNTPIASPLCFAFQSVVTLVNDPTGALHGAVAPQQVLTGHYVYNFRTLDSNALPSLGEFFHVTSSYGVEVNAPGLVFRSDPQAVQFFVRIGNGTIQQGQPVDLYEVRSDVNLAPAAGLTTDGIEWKLTDASGTAAASDALPDVPPPIGSYNGNELRLTGRHLQSGAPYEVRALATSCIPCSQVNAVTSDVAEIGERRIRAMVGPNPFRTATRFEFAPAVAGPVEIDIWDVAGRHVRRIASPAGGIAREAYWDGKNDRSAPVAAGVYVFRVRTTAGAAHGRIVHIR